jgi:iron complex transport system ATP-binding protein
LSGILEFRNVGFAYGERRMFHNLSFTLRKGEMAALLGPNGAGKTTLLKLASALLRPDAGEIVLDGRELGRWPRRELSRRVALVPQELDVPFAFRVEEIVAQGRVPHLGFFGGLGSTDLAAVESAMEDADILKLRHRVFAELSGGERQRVKIAIGLAQQPELMLLDEPTQHLDLGRQMELMAILRRLVERGITVMAAVHDLALAREHCASGVLLFPDAQAICGTMPELLRPELLERAYRVERAGLDRYLGVDARGDELDDVAASQQRKSVLQEHETRHRATRRLRHSRGNHGRDE